ncbi:hypothetical protein E6H27_06575 [Candidatus Bathyarchaeota archaeon]|nr:MAG: hypothetical protein E6H27_06575 [Candidatus Bathyarchaeota archaeon]
MSKRERTRVGEVRYGFDLVFPDAWILSVTREAGIHHHITCSKQFPSLQLTKHSFTGSRPLILRPAGFN